MTKILFVCHGNICRSPMAEFVMKHLVKEAGVADQFSIASAATSTEEIGNPVYPPAARTLAAHGVPCSGHAARQLRKADYESYDLLIGMDDANIRNMQRMCGATPRGKFTSFWTTQTVRERWQTPGTPAISRPLGGMCGRAATAFWLSCASTNITWAT